MIISRFNMFNEALKPSQFREYMNIWEEDPNLKKRYEYKFLEFKKKYDGDKNAYRIYLPLIGDAGKSDLEIEIEELLRLNNYEMVNYISGHARFIGAKNPKRIGQILGQLERNAVGDEKENIKTLTKKFIEDPNRKQGQTSEYLVCISRHPYDVAGADTDKKWHNCMTLSGPEGPGLNYRYLIHDVKEGSLVAFLINKNDKNLKDPIANCAIKPYINADDPSDFILQKDNKTYPQPYPDFEKTVIEFLKEFNGNYEGIFCLNNKLYNDNSKSNKIVKFKKLTAERIPNIAKVYGIPLKNLIINDDLSIDVEGDVDMENQMLNFLPLLFNKVSGSFNISGNNLNSLIGCPVIVGGDFWAYNNQLNTLEGGPEIVGGEYDVSNNYLNNLDHLAKEIGSHLNIRYNKNLNYVSIDDIKKITTIKGRFINNPRGENISQLEKYYIHKFKSFKN